MRLLLESAASKSLQKPSANICGQLRLRGRDIRNRLVYSYVYGVARKAWVSPACGPLSTVAIPTI
jgi:hypothetical protein